MTMGLLYAALFLLVSVATGEIVDECKDVKLDVYFVVDKSASIAEPEIAVERKVLKGIIAGFDIGADKIRVGTVVFSNDTEDVFSLGEYNKHSDYDAIDPVPRPYRKVGTLTHLGLENALVKFKEEGRTGVPQVIVVVTDGKSTGPVPLLVTMTKIHKTTDITVVSVGIGRDADYAELDLMASGKDGDNVYLANSFKKLDLIKQEITTGICESVTKDPDRATCPSLCISNGLVHGLPKAGETATVKCLGGYSVVGSANLTCQENGSWDVEAPKCLKDCHHKFGITYGTYEYLDPQENGVGGRVQYKCNEGYVLKGKEVITCKTNSIWSAGAPFCKRAQCKTYTRIGKGRVTQDNMIGGTANFTCDSNYALIGESTLTCQDNAKWDNSAPKCKKEVFCKIPRFFDDGNASHFGKIPAGETLKFKCQTGYELQGDNMQCGSSGKLEGDKPSCKNVRCPWLPFIKNGKIIRTGDNPVTQMTFECENGYTLSGASTLTCKDNRWDNKYPTCIFAKRCPPLRYFRNGQASGYSRDVGTTVKFVCNAGYKFSTDTDGSITCQNNYKWSADQPQCLRDEYVKSATRSCPQIIDIVNGRCTGSHQRFGKITCSCNAGYEISGKEVIRCQSGARWSIPMFGSNYPRCKYIRCKQLKGIANGFATYKEDNLGAVVRFDCRPGFELDGPRLMKCRDRKWDSPKLPVCRDVRCPNLIGIDNGMISGVDSGDNHGAVRSFTCNTGYELEGRKNIVCSKSQWEPAIPKCKRVKTCMSIDAIKYGYVEGTSLTVGSSMKFSCEPGYILVGPALIKCLPNRQWSGKPSCQRRLCEAIKYVNNGKAIGYNNIPGTTVGFECNEGFARRGNRFIFCQKDGTWNAPPPTCEAQPQCPTLCMNKGGVVYEGIEAGQWARFRCDEGYTLKGPSLIECQEDGTWDKDPPECVRETPKVCDLKKMDMYFVVEVSNPNNIEKFENMIKRIGSHFKIAGSTTRLGVISFDKKARVEVPLKQYQNETAFITAELLSREERKKGHNLVKALDLLQGSYIMPVTKQLAAFVITENRIQKPKLIATSAEKLHALGVSVFVLGLGDRPEVENMETIASGNGSTNVFRLDSADDLYVNTTSLEIATTVCNYESTGGDGGDDDDEDEDVLPTTTEKCKDIRMDCYIVVDTSKSIKDKELVSVEQTIRYLINNFDIGPNKTRLGLITYNKFVFEDIFLDTYDSREGFNALEKVVDRGPFSQLKGGTRTDLGLTEMMDNFDDESPDDVRKVSILITDGKATAPVKEVAKAMDKTDITRISIGVGSGSDRDELNLLATGNDGKYVVVTRNYDDLRLLDSMIAGIACQPDE